MLVDKFNVCDKIKEQIKKRNFVVRLTAESLSIYKEKHKSLMNRVDNNLKEINNKLEQIKALLK
jgi:hypothetical protein